MKTAKQIEKLSAKLVDELQTLNAIYENRVSLTETHALEGDDWTRIIAACRAAGADWDRRRNRTAAQVVEIAVRAYETAARIKSAKARICEKYGLNQKQYMQVIGDAKVMIKERIGDAVRRLQRDALGYDKVLHWAWQQVSTDADFALLSRVSGVVTGDDMAAFLRKWYAAVDASGALLVRRDYINRERTRIYTYMEPRTSFDGPLALGVVRNCLGNFGRFTRKVGGRVKDLDKIVWSNIYPTDGPVARYTVADKDGRIVKGDVVKETFAVDKSKLDTLQEANKR